MADGFVYNYAKTERVVYGVGSVEEYCASECDKFGAQRVVVLTTSSLRNTSILQTILDQLDDRCVGVFHESTQHVPVDTVTKLIAFGRERDPDLILSIGGGSVIDGGKALAAALGQGCTSGEELYEYRIVFEYPDRISERGFTAQFIPHIAIPTTLSAAEYDGIFGITWKGTKALVNHPELTPRVVILDPNMATHTPDWLWASTGMRSVDHAIEIYLSRTPTPPTDALSLHALKLLFRYLPISHRDPNDLEARLNCMTGAWLSMFGVDNVTLGLSHGIGHQIGARCDVPHGMTSCVMLPTVMEHVKGVVPSRVADLAVAMGVVSHGMAEAEAASAACDAVRQLIQELGLPTRLSEVKVTRDDFAAIADDAMEDLVVAFSPVQVSRDGILELLERAY
jgi:alcohol dehydrogenase